MTELRVMAGTGLLLAGVAAAGHSAAGFAIQQSVPRYEQVANVYTPPFGYYPLSPWAGLGVLCGYTALAMVAAAILLRRRDA